MANIEETIKEAYQKNLEPESYKKFKLDGLGKDRNVDNNYTFWFACLNDFFSSGKASGDRLLELGSGPTVHNVATASKYFNHIVLSEFVDSNCEALKKWLRNEPDILDWSVFLEMVAIAEGRSDLSAAVQEMESRIRSNVKAVVHADVLKDEVIPAAYSDVPFDALVSVCAFEVAAVDVPSHRRILCRANRLLRLGGYLVLIGVIDCSFWVVGGNKFHCLALTEEDVLEGLKEAGFGEVEFRTRTTPAEEGLPFNSQKVFFLSAKKISEA